MTKLLNILEKIDLSEKSKSKAEDYFKGISPDTFVYPNRLASKINTSNEKASELLYFLTLARVFEHVSVPMYPETRELFEERFLGEVVKKFSDNFVVQDDDHNEIHGNDLIPVAGFKLRAQ